MFRLPKNTKKNAKVSKWGLIPTAYSDPKDGAFFWLRVCFRQQQAATSLFKHLFQETETFENQIFTLFKGNSIEDVTWAEKLFIINPQDPPDQQTG